MSIMSRSKRYTPDSPSRQLIWELNRLVISDQERFLSRLDHENEQRERIHRQALAAAAEQHEKVRRDVELERQRLDAQIQAERERREAETRKELERQRREKAERDLEERKREVERTKAIEVEQRRLAELEKQQREASEAAKAQRQRQNEDAARRALEQKQAAERYQQVAQRTNQESSSATKGPVNSSTTPEKPPPATKTTTSQPSAPLTPLQTAVEQDPQSVEEHSRYLDIHRRLKELRKFMAAQGRENRALKDAMGDMRRGIVKSVGQLTEGKGANRQPLATILKILKQSLTFTHPTVPILPFLLQLPQGAPQDGAMPALLIYLLSFFSKAIIAQWINEAGVSPKAADPVGIIASHIFAHDDFKWQNTSLISILLAKLHMTCPILFGIYGPENTDQGRQRLGWGHDDNGWVSRQRHYERMTGLASGFAALSLRNYEKSKYKNPYPDYHYWQALARIANTPIQAITQTHFVVLKGMVENYEGKFIGFYGNAAVAALRVVLIDLPNQLPEDQKAGVAVKGIQALVDVLKRDAKLVL